MSVAKAPIIALVGLALALGTAAAWPSEGIPGVGHVLLLTALFFAVFALFFLVLPRFFKRPMQIFWGMALGAFAGWAFHATGHGELMTDYFGIFGTLFIQLLTMVIVPLVFVTIVSGVATMGDARRLGRLGGKTILYYCCTTAIAVFIGITCVNIIQPGRGTVDVDRITAAQEEEAEREATLGMQIQENVLPAIVPDVDVGQVPILPLIFSAIFLGAVLAAYAERTQPAIDFFRAMDYAIIQVVLWVMYLAPIGVFALMGRAIATMGLEYVPMLAQYVLTVVLALGLHFVVLVFGVLVLLGRISPVRFLRGMAPAIQLAFSSSSSSATLPVTLDCATRRVGSSRKVSSFMLPLGATINMDGTALYVAVAALFVSQVYGMDLTLAEQLMVFITAVAVSVGTAGIPGASVGLMTIIFASVGIPLEGIGIVIGVDRFLDMCRTLVNINGDAVGTVIISQSEGEMGEPETDTAAAQPDTTPAA